MKTRRSLRLECLAKRNLMTADMVVDGTGLAEEMPQVEGNFETDDECAKPLNSRTTDDRSDFIVNSAIQRPTESPTTAKLAFVKHHTDYGDIDGDWDVDSADRTIQAINWTGALRGGGNKLPRHGDVDGDGDVDSSDLTTLISNWTGAIRASQSFSQSSTVDAVFANNSGEFQSIMT